MPNTTTVYTVETFDARIEFPEGLLDQDQVVITINGIDITSELDLWGKEKNIVAISGRVDDGSYPLMMSAFRDGTNFLQMFVPKKEGVYFKMDLKGMKEKKLDAH